MPTEGPRERGLTGLSNEIDVRGWSVLSPLLPVVAVVVLVVAGVYSIDDRRRVFFILGGPIITAGVWLSARHCRGRVFGASAAVITAVLSLLCIGAIRGLGTSRDKLETVGDGIIRALEDYRRAHGRFPDGLDDAGIRPEWNRFGGWSYDVHEGGSRWDISVGDYMDDGFVMHRSSDQADWEWDS
jgi:hypothetical protein